MPPLTATRTLRVLYEDALAGNPGGTGTFVRGARAALQDFPQLSVISARLRSTAADLDVKQKSPLTRIRNGLRHLAYYGQVLPSRAQHESCDAIFCPTSLGPLRGTTPTVLTVFDLTPLRYPQTLDPVSRVYIQRMLVRGVRRARSVCTISQAVATELRQHFPQLAAGQVQVAYPGPNPELLEADPRPPFGPSAPFVLMVGTLEPRKNHLTVVRGLAAHVRLHPESDLRLVLAGSGGWRYGPLLEAIRDAGLTPRVDRLGTVEPAHLKWLYTHARALLFPSLYEGFGLPVLEAALLRCPVVAARIPSVMEIAGDDGAELLEPRDVEGWTAAIDRAAAGEGQPDRTAVAFQRAQAFTWQRCAQAIFRAITVAVGG